MTRHLIAGANVTEANPVEVSSGGTVPAKSLDAAEANGNGTAVDLGTARRVLAMQVAHTGTPTGGTIDLQGSLDGTNWFGLSAQFDIATDTSGDIVWAVDKPVRHVRANLASLAGGTDPTVTAWIAAGG